MPTNYIYGTILTGEAVAANNRGDNIGNTTTLQKVFHKDDLHTSVSAEAIRFAIRYRFQLEGLSVNRSYDMSTGKLIYKDEKRFNWNPNGDVFIDDDLMGFMDAAAAKQEQEEEESGIGTTAIESGQGEEGANKNTDKAKNKKKPKGRAVKRQSPIAIGRAVSLRPYRGELSFNSVSGEKEKGKLSLYNAEMHTTEYQYSFGVNLNDLIKKENIRHLIDAIIDLPPVAGNHSRFAYDFSPSSIVLRVTKAHSSKIQNCFEHCEETRGYTIERLIHRVVSNDIPASELILGGELSVSDEGKKLEAMGVKVFSGIKAAADEARKRIAELGEEYDGIYSEA